MTMEHRICFDREDHPPQEYFEKQGISFFNTLNLDEVKEFVPPPNCSSAPAPRSQVTYSSCSMPRGLVAAQPAVHAPIPRASVLPVLRPHPLVPPLRPPLNFLKQPMLDLRYRHQLPPFMTPGLRFVPLNASATALTPNALQQHVASVGAARRRRKRRNRTRTKNDEEPSLKNTDSMSSDKASSNSQQSSRVDSACGDHQTTIEDEFMLMQPYGSCPNLSEAQKHELENLLEQYAAAASGNESPDVNNRSPPDVAKDAVRAEQQQAKEQQQEADEDTDDGEDDLFTRLLQNCVPTETADSNQRELERYRLNLRDELHYCSSDDDRSSRPMARVIQNPMDHLGQCEEIDELHIASVHKGGAGSAQWVQFASETKRRLFRSNSADPLPMPSVNQCCSVM